LYFAATILSLSSKGFLDQLLSSDTEKEKSKRVSKDTKSTKTKKPVSKVESQNTANESQIGENEESQSFETSTSEPAEQETTESVLDEAPKSSKSKRGRKRRAVEAEAPAPPPSQPSPRIASQVKQGPDLLSEVMTNIDFTLPYTPPTIDVHPYKILLIGLEATDTDEDIIRGFQDMHALNLIPKIIPKAIERWNERPGVPFVVICYFIRKHFLISHFAYH